MGVNVGVGVNVIVAVGAGEVTVINSGAGVSTVGVQAVRIRMRRKIGFFMETSTPTRSLFRKEIQLIFDNTVSPDRLPASASS